MNAAVFEHVPVAELPEKWRVKLTQTGSATVTVRIEEEAPEAVQGQAEEFADDPLFGMWRHREDMADVSGYLRKLRASRFDDDGTRRGEA
jgi:hypothetical protein